MINSGFPSGFAGYIWNGTTFGTLGLADSCSLVFSHEMAECMTDPGGNGFEVNPGANWPNPAANSNQIGDYEGNSYSYRSHGGLVQPYWSAKDQQWLVTDGNSQTANVNPKWITNPNGTRTITYNVTVNGGQRGGRDALTIGSFAAQGNQPPGAFLTLNNEFFEFDNFQGLGNLTANISAGVVRVANDKFNFSTITVNGRQGTEVDVSANQAAVTINTAGTVNVGTGLLKNIGQQVSILGGGVRTDLTIDDASNSDTTAPTPSATIFSDSFFGNLPGLFVSVSFSGLRSLRVNGGSAGNTYDVENTPSSGTTLNTGAGNDHVFISRASGPLSVLGQGGSDVVTIGHDGTVRDIAKAVDVSNSGSGYTRVTVDDSADNVARTAIVYGQTTLGVRSTVIDGLLPGGDISLRSDHVSALTIRAGAGGNTVRIHDTPFSLAPGLMTMVDTGAGGDHVTVDGASGPLTVNGDSGSDVVNFGSNGSVRNIMNAVTVTNSGGFSDVNVDDSADTARTVLLYNNGVLNGPDTVIDGLIQGGDIVLRGADLRSLLIRTGDGGNTYRIHDTPTSLTPGGLTTTVSAGAGSDMVTVDGTRGALVLDGQAGDDNVFIGSTIGSLDRIQGPVNVTGGDGNDALTFNDQVTTTLENYTLAVDTLRRVEATGFFDDMAPVSFTPFNSVTLNVSSGGGSAAVTGSSAGSTVTVNGDPVGPNQFAVDTSSNAILGPVILHGENPNTDFAQYYDNGDVASHTFTLTSTSILRDGQAPVFLSGVFGTIVYASTAGGNTFNVNSVASVAGYKIVAADGDHVTVGSSAPGLGGTLADILGQVNVTSTTPNDAVSVVLDDSGNADTTATHLTFSGFDADGDVSLTGLTPVALSWNLSAASSVTIQGGAADEIFSMDPVVAVTPVTIVGGAGNNTLDYSTYTTDVSVDLSTGTATDLAGVSNIQNVIGGSGNDTLTAGADRSILIGGSGADQLFGGSGEDILIGGTTDFTQPNLDAAALDAIVQEWNRTDLSFDDRVSDLMTGSNSQGVAAANVVSGVAILLDSSTVHDDLAVDVLTGGTGRRLVPHRRQ